MAVSRGHQRAILKACGVTDAEINRPFIGVMNSWNEMVPGHIHLRGVAEAVKAGILAAGGTPFESNTIALCDAFSAGLERVSSTSSLAVRSFLIPSRWWLSQPDSMAWS